MTNEKPQIWSKIQIPLAIVLVLLAVLAVSRTLSGCSDQAAREAGNTKEQVAADHKRALQNIDNDTHTTAKEKELIKEKLGLVSGGQGRPTGPPPGAR